MQSVSTKNVLDSTQIQSVNNDNFGYRQIQYASTENTLYHIGLQGECTLFDKYVTSSSKLNKLRAYFIRKLFDFRENLLLASQLRLFNTCHLDLISNMKQC